MSDAVLRDAARLLRGGHPPDLFVEALDDESAYALVVGAMAARPEVLRRVSVRLNEGLARAAPGYRERRDQRRAAGLARAGSCLDEERWGEWQDPCTCCQSWGSGSELRTLAGVPDRCPCRCTLCDEVAEHLASCRRCPGDPCSLFMAERLGIVAPRLP